MDGVHGCTAQLAHFLIVFFSISRGDIDFYTHLFHSSSPCLGSLNRVHVASTFPCCFL
jgi:hypothetical protein